MRLVIAAIGRMRAGPERELVDDYARRINTIAPQLGFKGLDLRDFEPRKALQPAQRLASESDFLMSSADGAVRVVLDERGKAMSSEAFSRWLAGRRDESAAAAAFLIGGADGHAAPVRESADLVLSFGPATWPHMLARAMLCEQLYRAMTILSGHPYHRA